MESGFSGNEKKRIDDLDDYEIFAVLGSFQRQGARCSKKMGCTVRN